MHTLVGFSAVLRDKGIIMWTEIAKRILDPQLCITHVWNNSWYARERCVSIWIWNGGTIVNCFEKWLRHFYGVSGTWLRLMQGHMPLHNPVIIGFAETRQMTDIGNRYYLMRLELRTIKRLEYREGNASTKPSVPMQRGVMQKSHWLTAQLNGNYVMRQSRKKQ